MSLVLWPSPSGEAQAVDLQSQVFLPLGHVGDWLLDVETDVETDVANALTVEADVSITGATEADAANALVVTKAPTLVADSEADTAGVLALETDVALVADSETDTANALSAGKTTTLVGASEADAAQAISGQKLATLTAKGESDVAGTVSATQPFTDVTLTAVAEADSAAALALETDVSLTAKDEADSAQTLSGQKLASLTAVAEADSAGALAETKFSSLTPAAEADTAGTLALETDVSLTAKSETDTANALTFTTGVTVTNSFDGGTSGTAITVGNSNGASGTAFDAVSSVTGQTLDYSNVHSHGGNVAMTAATGSTAGRSCVGWLATVGTRSAIYGRLYFYATGAQAVEPIIFRALSGGSITSSTYRSGIVYLQTGELAVLDQGGRSVVAGMTTGAIPTNQWVRVEFKLTLSTTAAPGSCVLKVWYTDLEATASPDYSVTNSGTANLGGTADTYLFGVADTDANVSAMWWDDIGLSTVDYLGPAAPGVHYQTLETVAETDTADALASETDVTLVDTSETGTASALSYAIVPTSILATDLDWASSSTGGLGGAINGTITTNVANNVWDNVTSDESGSGDVEYRCVYVRNGHPTKTWKNVVVWVDGTPATGSADLALDSAAAGATATSSAADEDTAPAPSVSFSSSATRDAALLIGDIAAGSYKAVWLRRTIPPGAGAGADTISVRAEGGTP